MYYFRYYQFDEVIIREILGKKLSGRNRKDLDDVSEKNKMSLKKCRRQVKGIVILKSFIYSFPFFFFM
jgi:hypothetical protein